MNGDTKEGRDEGIQEGVQVDGGVSSVSANLPCDKAGWQLIVIRHSRHDAPPYAE